MSKNLGKEITARWSVSPAVNLLPQTDTPPSADDPKPALSEPCNVWHDRHPDGLGGHPEIQTLQHWLDMSG
ncbi:MAG: hypothetical protein NZM42_07935 [Gemmatales bacterium]|nr:hypothetical protein [Gemmatales bacterium]MDW8222200.1 hypothetical protein [Gemmatales bacterium]